MDKEQFLKSGLLEQYVLKLTTPEEDEIVMGFASKHPEIRQEIEELQAALEEYARQQAVKPPSELRERVLQSVNSATNMHSSGKGLSFLGGLGLVAAVALGFVVFIMLQNQQKHQQRFNELQVAYTQLESDCRTQAESRTAMASQLALLRNPATQRVQLSGTANTPEASVIVHWNTQLESGMLQIENLPPPPSGKTYQIWADVEGVMINAGLFDGTSYELQPITFIAQAESLNITLEPEGGSEHPTVELLQASGKV